MLTNESGYTMVEALTGMSILSFIIILTLPLQHLIQVEREVLHERRVFTYYLHDELMIEANREGLEMREPFSTIIDNKVIYITFESDGTYIKGCVSWTNAKKTIDEDCLYAIEKQ